MISTRKGILSISFRCEITYDYECESRNGNSENIRIQPPGKGIGGKLQHQCGAAASEHGGHRRLRRASLPVESPYHRYEKTRYHESVGVEHQVKHTLHAPRKQHGEETEYKCNPL